MSEPAPVIFDLDGTLIDSAPSLHRAAATTMRARGLPEPDLKTVTGFIGEGVAMLVARCLAWAGARPDAGATAAFLATYEADPITGTLLLPDARETLRALAAARHPLGLCTNKPVAATRALLDGLDLGPFGCVVCGDTLPVRKPDPAPLLHAVERLGGGRDGAVYVGDSRTDWRTATAAGIRYLHLAGGYETEAPPNGTPILRSLSEVPAAIVSMRRPV